MPHSLKVEFVMVKRTQEQECEEDGHMKSAVHKQRVRIVLYFLFSPGLHLWNGGLHRGQGRSSHLKLI